MHPEGAVERAVDDHVGRRVDDEQDVAEEEEPGIMEGGKGES